MRRVIGSEGNDDYVLVAESQSMWLAVKPFIVRMPISWSCVVGLRYRGGHGAGVVVSDPKINGMAWNIQWQKADLTHASASFPCFGLNASGPCTATELMDNLPENHMEKLVLNVCQAVDPRTRVHDFNVETLKGQFWQILTEQAKALVPGQDVPESIKHLPEEQIMQQLSNVLQVFLKDGAPDDYPYEKQGSKTQETIH